MNIDKTQEIYLVNYTTQDMYEPTVWDQSHATPSRTLNDLFATLNQLIGKLNEFIVFHGAETQTL